MSYCKSDNPHTCFIARNLSLHRPLAHTLKSIISSPIATLFSYHRTTYATFRMSNGEILAKFWRNFGEILARNWRKIFLFLYEHIAIGEQRYGRICKQWKRECRLDNRHNLNISWWASCSWKRYVERTWKE